MRKINLNMSSWNLKAAISLRSVFVAVVFLLRQLLGRWLLVDQQSNIRPNNSEKRPKSSSLQTETLNLGGVIGWVAFFILLEVNFCSRKVACLLIS